MHASYTGIQTAELYLQSSAPHHILHRTEYSKLPVRTAIENRMFEKLPLHPNIPPTLNYVINATKINLELKITQLKRNTIQWLLSLGRLCFMRMFVSLNSKTDTFTMGLSNSFHSNFSITVLTSPSWPGCTATTIPSFHLIRGRCSSFTRTTPPTWMLFHIAQHYLNLSWSLLG
jgi:hypothetical protein